MIPAQGWKQWDQEFKVMFRHLRRLETAFDVGPCLKYKRRWEAILNREEELCIEFTNIFTKSGFMQGIGCEIKHFLYLSV